MANTNQEERFLRMLFHLGKGLWKSIPVLGPIIEEVFYEQFRDELLKTPPRLSSSQIRAIREIIPRGLSEADIERALSGLSKELQSLVAKQLSAEMARLRIDTSKQLDFIARSAKNTDRIPKIEDIVVDIRRKIADSSSANSILQIIESRRKKWISRISANQVAFLNKIPSEKSNLDGLWELCLDVVPDCGYKEFRFRLHELEWLGLVERYWDKEADSWIYQKISLGEKRETGDG